MYTICSLHGVFTICLMYFISLRIVQSTWLHVCWSARWARSQNRFRKCHDCPRTMQLLVWRLFCHRFVHIYRGWSRHSWRGARFWQTELGRLPSSHWFSCWDVCPLFSRSIFHHSDVMCIKTASPKHVKFDWRNPHSKWPKSSRLVEIKKGCGWTIDSYDMYIQYVHANSYLRKWT